MKRSERRIYVFENDMVRVEVEGNTVSIQVVDPLKPENKWKGVLPLPIAIRLCDTLSSALAQSGEVVNDMRIVYQNVAPRASGADVVGE